MRPRPTSTRPWLSMSKVAMRAAVCRGWWMGANTTPTPMRIREVRWLTAARVRSGALL